MASTRAVLIWGALAVVVIVPLAIAANSPLLAWRSPVYIAAGLAGVVAMTGDVDGVDAPPDGIAMCHCDVCEAITEGESIHV